MFFFSKLFLFILNQAKNFISFQFFSWLQKTQFYQEAESRGFIFGSMLAMKLNKGFIPVRKPGKLPAKTIRQEFETEYSTDAFEMHEDAIMQGQKVIIVDDLLATGGTALAAAKLVEKLGGKVIGFCFLIELSFLHPREKLKGYEIFSLIKYDEE